MSESAADEFDEEDIPSGEALAAELTRFLRERDRKNGDPPAATEQSRLGRFGGRRRLVGRLLRLAAVLVLGLLLALRALLLAAPATA